MESEKEQTVVESKSTICQKELTLQELLIEKDLKIPIKSLDAVSKYNNQNFKVEKDGKARIVNFGYHTVDMPDKKQFVENRKRNLHYHETMMKNIEPADTDRIQRIKEIIAQAKRS